MSNAPDIPVGASVPNPSVATPQAGSEVTGSPSAARPAGAGAAPTTSGSSGPASVSEVVEDFDSKATPLIDSLKADLPPEVPGAAVHLVKVGPTRLRAIPMLSNLLRKYPTLVSDFTADDIDADLADATACTALSQEFTNAKAAVDNAQRVKLASAWTRSSEVRAVAEKRAAGNSDLARDLGPILATLATGPRAETAAHAALDAQQGAAKATARAAKAETKAAVKTAAAAALQHPAGAATATAPETPASTAPAATSGTPGNTPIR